MHFQRASEAHTSFFRSRNSEKKGTHLLSQVYVIVSGSVKVWCVRYSTTDQELWTLGLFYSPSHEHSPVVYPLNDKRVHLFNIRTLYNCLAIFGEFHVVLLIGQ